MLFWNNGRCQLDQHHLSILWWGSCHGYCFKHPFSTSWSSIWIYISSWTRMDVICIGILAHYKYNVGYGLTKKNISFLLTYCNLLEMFNAWKQTVGIDNNTDEEKRQKNTDQAQTPETPEITLKNQIGKITKPHTNTLLFWEITWEKKRILTVALYNSTHNKLIEKQGGWIGVSANLELNAKLSALNAEA